MTDRLGSVITLTYHSPTGKLQTFTNANGHLTTYTYAAQTQTFTHPLTPTETVTFTFYNLTRIDYPDGANEQFIYDSRGNILTYTDQAGQPWTYTYNVAGQITRQTNPIGGYTDYTYSADGTPATSDDSETGAVTYAYDAYKRLNRLTYPDGHSRQWAYNLNDQVTVITDENNSAYTLTYDANGNLTHLTDPANQTTTYTYDLMDRVSQITDRLGQTTLYGYDVMGRTAVITGPTGLVTTFGYDPRGWLNQMTRAGQTWQFGYDNEGILTSATTPSGRVTTYQSDNLGLLTRQTNPLNQATNLSRDAMSRVTGLTDPLNHTTTYAYNGYGLVSSVTKPVIGAAVYRRNNLGLVDQITDLNGQNWAFAYTTLGRPQSRTDPLGHAWSYTYDQRGRPAGTTFPDAGTLTPTYDPAGNLTRLRYSTGPDLNYTYNALNRLTGADGLQLTYNAEGQVTQTQDGSLNFGATYNAAGQVKTVTYNNGAFTVTYTYNAASGLLTQAQDTLGNTVNFTYDIDRRLTKLTRSNGVTTTYTYDNADRLTRIQAGTGASTFIDLQHTLDAAGQVTRMQFTAPLDPGPLIPTTTLVLTYDAASQINSAGYSYDSYGRLTAAPGHTYTWDGASRLVGVDGVTLTYNGLDDLRTRAEGGQTTHFYYNYALGLTPIVAEQIEGGAFQRYYVWTPGGQLLYMIDAAHSNQVYFYHFDHAGSTLALTNGSGSVADTYAYDSYGRVLSHTGSNPQPFTFAGQVGVRQEGAGGTFYHMRARYYDATAARFISRDPLWPQLADAHESNPYVYVSDNPLNHSDPTGLTGFTANDLSLTSIDRPLVAITHHGEIFENYLANQESLNSMVLLAGQRQSAPKFLPVAVAPQKGKWDKAGEIALDQAKGKIEEWVQEKAQERFEKEIEKKLAQKYGREVAEKIMKAAAKKLNTAGTLYEGAVSVYTLAHWATLDSAELGAEMSQELSYQVVELTESTTVGKAVVGYVGSWVSWLMGD